MPQLILFIVLQLLDLVTTIWFTHFGVGEGNPFVVWLATFAPTFVQGLVQIKIVALATGWFVYHKVTPANRKVFFYLTNCWFALIVIWNLVGILMLRLW